MSNLDTAKRALLDEIETTKAGAEFYNRRIGELEKLLENLEQIDSASRTSAGGSTTSDAGKRVSANPAGSGTTKSTGRGKSRGRPPMRQPATDMAQGSKKAKDPDLTEAKDGSAKRASKLPATKSEFWLGLLSEQPVSNKEWLKAATGALKIRPNPSDMQKLKQRLANFVTIATREGSLVSEGSGRARRFSVRPGASGSAAV